MNRTAFRDLVARRPVFLDGSTGVELLKLGLPAGACPEKWAADNPDAIQAIHRAYAEAGSDIILACTFGANRLKLADHGLADLTHDINRELIRIGRAAVGDAMLFGDLSPTGRLVEPFGDLPFEEAVDIYREQAEALLAGGVDGFMIETMIDIQEARAALLAVRSLAPDHPILVSMTYDADGRTIAGAVPAAALVTLQALGADAVGMNCSTGPDEMLALLGDSLPFARVPLLVKPNAGMPETTDGCGLHYPLDSETFADFMSRFAAMGIRL